jgi:hypothetical protein
VATGKPEISLVAPASGAVVNGPAINVAGQVAELFGGVIVSVQCKVNDGSFTAVLVQPDGSFSGSIPTPPNDANATLVCQVLDGAGNKTSTAVAIVVEHITPPTNLNYAVNSPIYTTGVSIATNVPSHDGGAVAAYTVEPQLPAGLSLNVINGSISGVPTAIVESRAYTITAENIGGKTNAIINIQVNPPPPLITTEPTDRGVYEGMSTSLSVSASGTGALSYQWYRNGVAIDAATASLYGTGPLGLADSGVSFKVLVSDMYGGRTFSKDAVLHVKTLKGFGVTGNLGSARYQHAAVSLPGGKVLVVGGSDRFAGIGEGLSSAELYDPVSGEFAPTGSMTVARVGCTATLLTNGKVLVAGGSFLASAELYDPNLGLFTPTGSMGNARSSHTATLLGNGKVLIVGGTVGILTATVASAELYDPATGLFASTGSLAVSRYSHTATLLPSGKVLIAGGGHQTGLLGGDSTIASAELYDPSSGKFSPTGGMGLARSWHTATLLANGKVLIAGGLGASGSFTVLSSVELYDPVAGSFLAVAGMATPRTAHAAVRLPSGKVLLAGGEGGGGAIVSVELYDPISGLFNPVENLDVKRSSHTATLMEDGTVLVAGGYDGAALNSAEMYK